MRDEPLTKSADLEQFRCYLHLLARMQLGRQLQGKLDASNVVQQIMLHAHRATAQFRDEGPAKLTGWLRQILARNLAHIDHYYRKAKREVARERSLEASLTASSARLTLWLAATTLADAVKYAVVLMYFTAYAKTCTTES